MLEATPTLVSADTRYELPAQGTSLLGYVARRMHKTALLAPTGALLAEGRTDEALRQVALYAAAASASFGRAYYQPRFNAVGERVSEPDPETGANVEVWLAASSPRLRIEYAVEMPDGGRLDGAEEITGTTVGVHGLGMPAPSHYTFRAGGYTAELRGTIVSELVPGLFFRSTRIRAHGALQLSDSLGNSGTLTLARSGDVEISVSAPGGPRRVWRARMTPEAR